MDTGGQSQLWCLGQVGGDKASAPLLPSPWGRWCQEGIVRARGGGVHAKEGVVHAKGGLSMPRGGCL